MEKKDEAISRHELERRPDLGEPGKAREKKSILEYLREVWQSLTEKIKWNSRDLDDVQRLEVVEPLSEQPKPAATLERLPEIDEVLERSVEYKGRTIFIEGHEHLNPMDMDRLSKQALLPENTQEYNTFINGFINRNAKRLEDYRLRCARLINTIRSRDIKNIGLEYTTEEAKDFNPESAKASLQLQMDMMKLYDIENYEQKAQDVFLLLHGEVAIVSATKPELFKNIRIIGMENPEVHEEALGLVARHTEIRLSLIDRCRQMGIGYKDFAQWDGFTKGVLEAKNIPSDEEIDAVLGPFKRDEIAHSMAEKGIWTIIQFIKNAQRRDMLMTASVRDLEGNAIILVGAQHMEGIKQGFSTE